VGSGIGGDELFAGYPIFPQFYNLKKRAAIFDHSGWIRKPVARLLPALDQRTIRLKGFLSAPASDITHLYPLFRQIQHTGMIRKLTGMPQGPDDCDTLEKLLGSKREAMEKFGWLSQVSIADYLGYTQSVLLKDADQMSMAASLELREPFFDNDLVEYVLNIPDEFKYPDYPKKLLVESVEDLLPPEIVFRKKQGFVLPYDLWLRNELKDFCENKIRRLAARNYFASEPLLQLWEQFLHRQAKIRWADIWIFVVLEHWLEKNDIN
jgi:asparagine synthase (glutamine-hydrolysing)